ncbi:MAG: GNAT family N-acetyltransferase [Acidimicrobiia bacterium]|nr:GNAT family N-acetyltransferase [Acidimicrobiia bacterium]
MAAYPSDYDFHVVLRDGGLAHIRPIKPEDAEGLHNMFHRLGRDSVYHRFFRHKQDLSEEELGYFTDLDYDDRMAFVVELGTKMVAVGRYDRMEDDAAVAEVAFVVEDGHQGRGIGTQLLTHLTNYARNNGVTAFRAFVLPDNYPMMRVFRSSGFQLRREMGQGIYTVEFPVELTEEAKRAAWQHEQHAVAASLLPMFYPRSVAIVGASREERSIGARVMRNTLRARFSGVVFPVNPNAPAVGSVKAYKSVLDIPDSVDMAVLVVPARFVLSVVQECADKGVKALVVISAGFSETGDAGTQLETELLELVRSAGMRMVGPNCMGMLNTDPAVNLDVTFSPTYPPRGNVAMSSQSGALGIAILDYARQLDIGISSFVSMGNKADVSANDLLLYWEGDPSTDVILLYLESFGHPRRFARISRRVNRKKPIVVVKSGRSQAGARAASSHTGSMASGEVAVSALFRQTGMIRTDTLEELFEVATLLANQPLPGGRRVGVLTNAGGPGILAADALSADGLDLPLFSPALQEKLRVGLAAEAAAGNPVDMIASAGPDQYQACLRELLASDEIDSVMVIYIPTAPRASRDVEQAVADVVAEGTNGKTVLSVFMQADDGDLGPINRGEIRIPSYAFPEPAARALARAVRYAEWRARPEGVIAEFDDTDTDVAQDVIWGALGRLGLEGGWLLPHEADAVLDAYGIPHPKSRLVHSREEAVQAAAEFGGPVALKVVAPSALHKSDVGGLALNLTGDEEVAAGYDRVAAVAEDVQGVFVQEFVKGGHEVIVGMAEDPSFGPLIAFGLGGVFVELIKDISFRMNPITDIDVDEMISEVKAAKMLEGYRGGPAGDIPALKDLMQRLSALVEEVPEIVELDLNPVKVLEPGRGAVVVDTRVRVRSVPQRWLPSRKDIPAAERRLR